MTRDEAIAAARKCTSYERVDELLHQIEDNDAISDRAFYDVKRLAIDAVAHHELSLDIRNMLKLAEL